MPARTTAFIPRNIVELSGAEQAGIVWTHLQAGVICNPGASDVNFSFPAGTFTVQPACLPIVHTPTSTPGGSFGLSIFGASLSGCTVVVYNPTGAAVTLDVELVAIGV